MRRQITGALGTVLAVGLTLVASAGPAAARTTGKESFRVVLAASGESGARTVFSTLIAARGVFTGAGRIVEVANRRGDADNVSRDDLVFPQGKMHLVNTNKSVTTSVNSQNCAVRIRIRQAARVQGGTRKFRHAVGRFTGSVRARGVAPRNADGTCGLQGALLLEVDLVSGRGTLSI
jgi:hypothetical protein